MAAEATERWSDRRYQKNKSAQKAWDVINALDEDEAVLAAGIPQKGASHPLDANLKADEPEASREGFNYYIVRVSYSKEPGDDGTSTSNPLDEPARIQWDFGNGSEPIDRDIEGNPIVNSALDAFDPPPSADFGTITVTVTRNLLTFDPFEAVEYQNTCNEGPASIMGIFTLEEGQGRILYIKPTHDYANSAQYVNVATVIEIRKDGHQLRILDQGERGFCDDGGSTVTGEIYHGDGTQVSSPVRLDGGGAPFEVTMKVGSQGNALVNIGPPAGAELETTDKACFLKYKRYVLKPWGSLGLASG